MSPESSAASSHTDVRNRLLLKRGLLIYAGVILALGWIYGLWQIRADRERTLAASSNQLVMSATILAGNMQAMINDGVGAAALIRALEPVEGVEIMRARRRVPRDEDLCNGPGKLTQALGIWLDLNGTPLLPGGPIEIEPGERVPDEHVAVGGRIGITKAADLQWRFCDARSRHVSRPWPDAMRANPPRRQLARAA